MTKSNQIFETKRIVGIILLLLIYIASNAQVQNEEPKSATNSLFKDANIGYIIIVGILGFGISAYIIITIVEKYQNKNRKPEERSVKYGSNRHHHHKIVKKSA
jgi:hypothetical protein